MKQKTPTIQADARTQIAETIPKALEQAITSYQEFSACNAEADVSKEFQSQHTAAKAALSHIELLLRLAAIVDVVDEGRAATLTEIIENAHKELEKGE